MFKDIVCRTIGCSSIFARWFAWPHKVCLKMFLPNYDDFDWRF